MRRLRRRQGDWALLEGPHLVEEALRVGLPLDTVLVAPDFRAGTEGGRLTELLPRPPIEVETAVLERLFDADSPRGILAVARLARPVVASLPRDGTSLWLYLDRIQDPGNLGALARVAEAFGAGGLLLTRACAHPNHPRALRASAGSLLRLPVGLEASVTTVDAWLGQEARWAGLAAHGGAAVAPGWRAAGAPPALLAVGSEGAGLSTEVESRLSERWTIPLCAPVESLNVAVAAAVALFALRAAGR